MHYRSVKGFSGWGQLGILVVFLGLGFVMAAAIQFLIGLQLVSSGLPVNKMGEEMMKALMKPEHVGLARLTQVLSTFFILFLPAALYLIICHGKNIFWLGFNRHINGWQILVGFFLIFFANAIASPLADLSKNILAHFPSLDSMAKGMENTYSEQVAVLSNLKSWPEFLMALVIMAFIPALFEEIFFRGALQNLLVRWWKAPLPAILFTSVVFSIIHMSIYLFLSRLMLGFILGWMYQRSKNLWLNIIAHFLNNTVALFQLFWILRHNGKIEMDKLDPQFPLWVGFIAAGITVGLFFILENVSAKNRIQVKFEEQNLLDKADPFHYYHQH